VSNNQESHNEYWGQKNETVMMDAVVLLLPFTIDAPVSI
jgi:hypothetical protein